jgi:hypothetical protein
MERASLMYAMRAFDAGGQNLHVMLFFGGFMIVLALMLGASVYQLWHALAAVSGRRRVRFEPLIKD